MMHDLHKIQCIAWEPEILLIYNFGLPRFIFNFSMIVSADIFCNPFLLIFI
jgi:hypothetical protein